MRRTHGTTLIELLVTITVAATLLALGHQGWRRLVSDNRQVAAVNQLVAAIQFARVHAHQHMRPVVLCPSPDASACDNDAGRWDAGWLAFVDWPPASGNQLAPEDEIILVGHAVDGQRVTANRPAFIMRPLHVRSSNGTFVFCAHDDATPPKAVIVSYTGRPRVARTRPNGATLRCQQ